MTLPNITDDGRLALTPAEISILQSMLDKNDRAGFYLAYYQMTGNAEALLTAKISTFSGPTGGVAFAANWLLQNQFSSGGPEGNLPYKGIYALSQDVAKSVLLAIQADVAERDDRRFDEVADGLITPNRLFIGAFDAWARETNHLMFPGNFLIALDSFTPGDQSIPDWSAIQAQNSEGFDASIRALFYASSFGKRQSDFPSASDLGRDHRGGKIGGCPRAYFAPS